jgi:hypothetical protein
MRSKRIIWFFLMIFLGTGAGLLYGWFVQPLRNTAAPPETLSADYKADFVLMAAEIYRADQDLEEAAARLAYLGKQPPDEIAAGGLATARALAYSVADLALMERLYRDLFDRAGLPTVGDPP